MDRLDGKVAVVTGAGSGIGRALATRFAIEGMSLVVADIDPTRLAGVEQEIAALGRPVVGLACDVSRANDVERLAAAAVETFGGAHVVCNNAGVMGTGDAWNGPLGEWEWVLGVNLYGVVHGVRTFLPLLQEQGEGHIVNTASMAGLTAMPGAAPYVVSKHGVVGLSESLYLELKMAGSPVSVSVLCPGFVRTGLMDSPWDHTRGDRPSRATAPVAANTFEALTSGIESGMPPDEVAGHVVDAIHADRFWILTHGRSRTDPLDRAIRVAHLENPAVHPPSAHPHLARVERVLRSKLPHRH